MAINLKHIIVAVSSTLAMAAHASPLMELDAANLVRAAGYVKEGLALTPNQQTLWQQVSGKSATMLRARQSRRDKLQAALKTQLQNPAQELRPLSGAIDEEAATSARENAQLRELWLTVNDALTDAQRLQVGQFLVTQLDRVEAPEHAPGGARGERPDGGQHQRKPGAERGGAHF
jgi:hypothetical protein